jgi:hypothetical protein
LVEAFAGSGLINERAQVTTVDRRAALTAHLEREAANGFEIETRSATQAVVVRNRRGWRHLRRRSMDRRVLSIDEDGLVTTDTAQPLRW